MPHFRVTIGGSHVLMEVEGVRRHYGFSVVRVVHAPNGEAAITASMELVLNSRQFKNALNPSSDPPTCVVEFVAELARTDPVPTQQPGFAFYPEDAD